MAEHSGFFDAHESVDALGNVVYDRVYLAESFAKYFASFIGNGIFGGKSDELMVKQKDTADMSIKVLSGQAFINGYFYENTDELSIAIDNADGVLNRIDLIVLRWDKYERVIRLAIEKGTPASSPSAPLLKRNDDYYELELAKVSVKAGATKITQVDITDSRLDSNVCGFVVGVVDQFDTAEFSAQLNAWIEEFKLDSVEEVEELLKQLKVIIAANDLGPILNRIEEVANGAVKKIGDTMTGDLTIDRAVSTVNLRTPNGTGRILKNANATSDLGTDISDETVNGVRDRINLSAGRALADKLRLVVSGEKIYRILHTGNMELIKPADIGAVNKAGDTMTGNLGISKETAPTFMLTEQSTGASLHIQFWNNQLFIANRPAAGDDLNYRTIFISNHVAEDDIVNAIGLSDVRDGVANFYTVIHTGNLPAFGIGAVPASVE